MRCSVRHVETDFLLLALELEKSEKGKETNFRVVQGNLPTHRREQPMYNLKEVLIKNFIVKPKSLHYVDKLRHFRDAAERERQS
jgi:hypothetical protein